MKPITKDSRGVKITIEAKKCDLPIEGNVTKPGVMDEIAVRRLEQAVREKVAEGNAWAWCEVHVTVTYRGVLSHTAAIGGVSYNSESDFRHDNGYFGELVDECITRINAMIADLSDDKEGA